MTYTITLGKQKLALGAGFFSMTFASNAVVVLAIPFYQMTMGVDPFLLSLAMALPIGLGIIASPFIGHLSDQSTSRFGRRKPFIAAGAFVSAISFGAMWMVPQSWSSDAQIVYFSVTYLLFYFASLLVAIPTTSLSYEVSKDPTHRMSIMVINTYFIKAASLLYQWLYPVAGLASFSSILVGIKWVGWSVAIVLIGAMALLPTLVCKESTKIAARVSDVSFSVTWRLLIANRALRWLMGICLLQLGGSVFAASMDYYLLVYYVYDGDIAQGAVWKGILSTAYAVVGFASVPFVSLISRKIGKEKSLQILLLMSIFGGVLKWFLFVPGIGWWIILDAILCSSVWTALTTIIPVLNAQLSDEHKSSHRRPAAGMFAAAFSSVAALAGILALVTSGIVLNTIGFDANNGAQQTDFTLHAMRLILSLGTCIFGMLSLLCLLYYRSTKND
ncbi:MFS transporter [Alteromonas stellipolaris]|uniref:MFS transporter n=1 Tax=Alteromonas stellipolaris TaxID=233316 RepID=UPI0007B45849|nr:MFS transporter [Alteromonas stellipolaris]ANB21686.1 hypothetical protein A6K25_10595 [Alteromonas stellipolaris]MDO6533168.1 MFS transporter [Alteromonas stellipolaris]MDO6624971.1 MFS transporter [Alteromonas stellipolaris]MDP2594505.1 MFS transporter [Alteromonas stellipolaris]